MKTYIHVICTNFDGNEITKKFRLNQFIAQAGELVLLYSSIKAEQKLCRDEEFIEIEQNKF